MAFDARALFAAIQSEAQKLGVFDNVLAHEPKSAPGRGTYLAIWWESLEPYPQGSGLASVSARLTLTARAYRSFLPDKQDDSAEPVLLGAVVSFWAGLAGAFTLGGLVRNVDLLGASGEGLTVRPGYIEIDGKHYRVADMTIGLIINDLWTEAP